MSRIIDSEEMEGLENVEFPNSAACEKAADLKHYDPRTTESSENVSSLEVEAKNKTAVSEDSKNACPDEEINNVEEEKSGNSLDEEKKDENHDSDGANGDLEVKSDACLTEGNIEAVEEEKHEKQKGKPPMFFVIREYNAKKGNNDFTNGEQPLIRNSTIEELKLKLENKEILVRQRPNTPTSPLTPNTPTTPTKQDPLGDDSDDMIPETRAPSMITDDGLIAPRKPANPVREDPGRQNLHRELLFNQKIGKNVLNQKSELQRALERHKDNVAKKQLENHIKDKPELEKVIADRARRLENPVKKEENEDDKVINKEFLQARMKLKSTNEIK